MARKRLCPVRVRPETGCGRPAADTAARGGRRYAGSPDWSFHDEGRHQSEHPVLGFGVRQVAYVGRHVSNLWLCKFRLRRELEGLRDGSPYLYVGELLT